jgi:hypothetical protein
MLQNLVSSDSFSGLRAPACQVVRLMRPWIHDAHVLQTPNWLSCWPAKRGPKGVNLVASFCNMYYACTEDVSCLVEKANSMIADLFNEKPSDESISCHPTQIAGIDLGQIVSSHHPCHLKYILQVLPFFSRFINHVHTPLKGETCHLCPLFYCWQMVLLTLRAWWRMAA